MCTNSDIQPIYHLSMAVETTVKTCVYIAYTCTYIVQTCTYVVHGYHTFCACTTKPYSTAASVRASYVGPKQPLARRQVDLEVRESDWLASARTSRAIDTIKVVVWAGILINTSTKTN